MEIVNYLEHNGLGSVLVRSNQYAPFDELKRMFANDQIRPIWKSTFGTYNLLKYTLLPGRLLGGDWYNPYSNSLHVYSDVPTLAIHVLHTLKMYGIVLTLGLMRPSKTFRSQGYRTKRRRLDWLCNGTKTNRLNLNQLERYFCPVTAPPWAQNSLRFCLTVKSSVGFSAEA